MTDEEIDNWCEYLAPLDLEERIMRLKSWDEGACRFGMTTALGYSGMVMLDHVRRLWPTLNLYFIDTRLHFPETLELLDLLRNDWGLSIEVIETVRTEREIEERIGVRAFEQDPDSCCWIRKVEPLMEILPRHTIWLHALRRDQSPSRAGIRMMMRDSSGVIKGYPIADWTKEQCWDYLRKREVPYNSLHDQSYPSVGCTHCTTPVQAGGDEREGRWVSFPKTECGLHGVETGGTASEGMNTV